MQINLAQLPVGISIGGAAAPASAAMPSWIGLWNEWEIQTIVAFSFSLQVILFFFSGIRRYNVSFILKVLLWLVYLLADLAATYALGHMSSSLSKKSSGEHQLVAFWSPFLLLHLGGQDTITAYALEDNELWLRHLLYMFVQVAGTAYVLYKYIIAGGATFVPAAMLILAAGVMKYGERIWALKLASNGGSGYEGPPRRNFLVPRRIYAIFRFLFRKKRRDIAQKQNFDLERPAPETRDCFTRNRQFGTYAYIVMTAHALCYVLVKPLIIDRNDASIEWSYNTIGILEGHVRGYQREQSGDESAQEKRHVGELYEAVEVELALMYDMLYTKAQVIHTRYGYCIRAISLVSCFASLVIFTKSKRDGHSTPDIVITFALLGGACALEIASVFKVIGSTWTYAILKGYGWKSSANAILFARYHLVAAKDGRWSDSSGQLNFIFFCVYSDKNDFKGGIAHLIGLSDWWNKAHCTKHVKLSPAVKEFVWDLLKGERSHMVQIEDVAVRSGYWARRFRGFNQSEELDWSMSFEFQKSVLIWHIATSTFLNDSAIKSELVDKDDKDMAEAVNTLSDYMMYLLVKHPDILPTKAAARNLFKQTWTSYVQHLRNSSRHHVVEPHQIIMQCKEGQRYRLTELYGGSTDGSWSDDPGEAVLVKACSLVQTMLDMNLELTHKMVIIGRVWTEMLCYAATNASGGFHARQLSNGGEFLTHILVLATYCAAMPKIVIKRSFKAADETADASTSHFELNVDDDSNDEITEIRRPIERLIDLQSYSPPRI